MNIRENSENTQYETDIGLEVHVELATKTKIFCGCSTAFGAAPNAHACPVCMGMPGALPVLNRQAVEYAMAVGLATHCSIAEYCRFDRKNYFYPDNPQGYQITQFYLPLCRDGYVGIAAPGASVGAPSAGVLASAAAAGIRLEKTIRIREIHMEEDAGKLFHKEGENCSLVDYNRSGVPLIEIVTEPDMKNAQEVIAFLEKLRLIIRYLGASDCKMQEGSMRVDVNLSVREAGSRTLGTRTEMKNLNSFKAVTRAIEEERKRQIGLLCSGEAVAQETRRWDDAPGCSHGMRTKEDARDYRYFPEPDLGPLRISEEWVTRVRARQPELPDEKRERYRKEYAQIGHAQLSDYDIAVITQSRRMAELFEETAALCGQPKKAANWLMGETLRLLRQREMEPEEIRFSPGHLAALIELVQRNVIHAAAAKEVFEAMFDRDVDPVQYVEEMGLRTISDDEALERAVREAIAANPKSVEDYRNGKERAFGFLVGQTMKLMQGKADPATVHRLLQKNL